MKTIVVVIVTALWSFSDGLAQGSRELPVIADRVPDVVREMFQNSKGKSQVLVDGDDQWNVDHGDLHCNGPVYAIAPRFDNRDQWSYIGGAFTEIDGIQLRGIAQLNDGDLTEVGGGISEGVIYAIVHDTLGLYVAGTFKKAGDISVHNIARWDADGWHDLGGGTDSTVLALCIFEGKLYAGGNFTKAGGVAANHLAAYDPGTNEWKPVMYGGVNGVNGGVAALATNGLALIAGGGFTQVGSKEANKVAVYKNKEWLDIGGVSGTNAFVACLTIHGDLTVGGSFSKAGPIEANNIAEYYPDADRWRDFDEGTNGPVFSICRSKGGVFIIPPIVVCGSFTKAGTVDANNIAGFNDYFNRRWEAWGSGLDKPAYALKPNRHVQVAFQTRENTIEVGGEFTMAGGKPSPNFAIHYEPSRGVETTSTAPLFSIHPSVVSVKGERVVASLSQHSNIRLSLADALGRELLVIANGQGGTEMSIPTESLKNGMYYCLLEADGVKEVRKLLVAY